MKPIAIQLYTLREAAAKDFPCVLKRVAEIGYKAVEFAGMNGMCPCEVKKIVDDLGLEVCSGHMAMPNAENAAQLIEECNTLGVTRLVTGYGPDQLNTAEGCMQAVEWINAGVAALEGSGICLGIHNHFWEFEKIADGRYPEDILLDNCPGAFAQIDVYWAAVGGVDPAVAVAERKARVPLLHIKDGDIEPKMPMKAIGSSGKIDFAAVIGAADCCVLKYLIVELDEVAGCMWTAVEESYKFLVGNGLAAGNK
jgi:sugar phosphate isomerase/epimerase